jgi:hypothetical protein
MSSLTDAPTGIDLEDALAFQVRVSLSGDRPSTPDEWNEWRERLRWQVMGAALSLDCTELVEHFDSLTTKQLLVLGRDDAERAAAHLTAKAAQASSTRDADVLAHLGAKERCLARRIERVRRRRPRYQHPLVPSTHRRRARCRSSRLRRVRTGSTGCRSPGRPSDDDDSDSHSRAPAWLEVVPSQEAVA